MELSGGRLAGRGGGWGSDRPLLGDVGDKPTAGGGPGGSVRGGCCLLEDIINSVTAETMQLPMDA